jgi:hypothetical protein
MPSNTTLTPSMILKEVYAIMHQESNFIMRTNRQYDGRFANRTLKIGQELDIRLPAKYTTRRGNTMSTQNYVERKVPLPLATIDGIDLNFGQEELTFNIQDFSERVLKPAVSQLVATVENGAMSTLYKKVANFVGVVTTATTTKYREFQTAGRYLTENLAPKPGRTATLNPQTRVDFSDAVKGLFQSSDNIREQYVEGIMGRTGGFTCYENTLVPTHTSGTFTTAMAVTTSTTADTGFAGTGNAYPTDPYFSLKVDGANPIALKAGDIITISNVYDVHPETKQSLGYLKRFVVQDDVSGSGGTYTVPILPFPILAGAYQNVSAAIANNATVTLLGPSSGSSAITYGQNMMFHEDAFAFVTADLEDPSQYGAWGAREVFEGLSIRIWRQGDIVNGAFPCRLDLAWGTAAIYPEWACRWVHAQGGE